MKKVIALVALFCSVVAAASLNTRKPDAPEFYVYKDAGSRENHYIPSGWMGAVGDLKMSQVEKDETEKDTCIKVVYSGQQTGGQGWAGIYWQSPANNWGDKKGGYDLSNYKRLKFKVRGEKGNEYIEKFLMGGIQGQLEDGDSGTAETGGVELTKKYQDVVIELAGVDLSYVIGGFGVVFSAESNEKGAVIFIDDVRYEQ